MSNANFIDALRYGDTLMAARFRVYKNGVPYGPVQSAAMSTGSITVDRTAEFRRSGSINLEVIPPQPGKPLPLYFPLSPTSLINPFGTELLIEVGIATPDAVAGNGGSIPDSQYQSLGLFRIVETQIDDQVSDCVVTLTLNDRGYTLAQRTLQTPYDFPATPSKLFTTEIQTFLNKVWQQDPNMAPLVYNITPNNIKVPQASFNQGADPFASAQQIAQSVGYELFFDPMGVLVARPIPNPLTQPVTWNYTDSPTAIYSNTGTGSNALNQSPYSTAVEEQLTMTSQGIYNMVVIQGTGTANATSYNGPGGTASGTPTLAVAADNNPNSPTYVKGGLGTIPNFDSSSLITSAGAQSLANSELQISLSSAWTATLTVPAIPQLDVDDVITITRPRIGLVNAKVVVDTITHGLSYADMTQVTGRILTNDWVPGSLEPEGGI